MAAKTNKKSVEEKYKKHELRTHIIELPDSYIGSIEPTLLKTYIYDNDSKKMVEKDINYIPGLLKIFDEIIVNAIDHGMRLKSEENAGKENIKHIKNIKVSINKETGWIEVFNDGNGIDVEKHSNYNDIWIPELIFGELLTSTNYDKEEEKIWGGKNGFGAKLTNIFSKEFNIETIDHYRKRIYTQTFRNNMTEKEKASVRASPKQPYTKISFLPDYERFGLQNITDDIYELFHRRVIDACATTNKDVSVYFNDEKIAIKDFEKYAELFIDKEEQPYVYESYNERWEVVAAISKTGINEQISFVNGINTIRGGRHVEYISNMIIKKMVDNALSKKKKTIKPQHIKDNLFIFVKSIIVNPSFDSQSKETLTTPVAKFGSKCELSDKFYDKLFKSGIIEKALSLTEFHDQKKLVKTDGKKTSKLIIPKLDDANLAGTKNSTECTLILTEGDSAKTMAIAGLSVIGRDRYGVFPLRGKIMNVKDAAIQKITDNNEITAIKKIMGLEQNKKYTDLESLRYGSIMIMTDQDHDGSHIKGLLFNVFQSLWPSLYKIDGFLTSMLTPIIKASNNKNEVISFYNMSDYNKWEETDVAKKGSWKIKYYKGLGTSKDDEAKEYFKNMKKITYKHTENSDEYIDLAFNKKRADDRKEWLMKYDKDDVLDYTKTVVNYETFINKDLIHFSNRDLERSINHLCDGLKESTRKILYACLKRKLFTNEIKVAQLAGNVSEVTAYHHGENSLQQAIIGMAQIYVGTNNINLLVPNGQFGCLAPNTEILMWDTSIKKAKDIIVGDKLVGDDGTIRNVLKTTSGVDNMYEINMINGEKYVVNSQHILTLKYSRNKVIYYKESSKTWKVEYYDNINNKILSKSISTIESTINNHYNSSKLSKEEAYIKICKYVNNLNIPDIYDIKIEDLLKLSKSQQKDFYCIKNSKCIQWEKKSVPIDPYILGCWLGDGNSNGSGITSIDDEILKSFVIYLDSISCELTHDKNGNNHENCHFTIKKRGSGSLTAIGSENHSKEKCEGCQTSKHIYNICDWKYKNKYITDVEKFKGETIDGSKRNDMNPWKELLKKYNLFNNKHIPNDYILNDKETRLQLLAGFIDTDGSVKYNNGIPIIQITQSERLRSHIIKSLQLIANSLGYKTHVSVQKINKETKKGENISMSVLLISGDNIDEIPTKLPRKKIIFNKSRLINPYNIRFSIKELGQDKFCGWSVDNNERFLLGDFTITHNSRISGGGDASSPRYIYTLISKLSKLIFREEDNCILNYLEEDGQKIEPEYYIPIIPMILVNGGLGIGTGFSTNIPLYNPEDIINICNNICNNIDTNINKINTEDDLERTYKLLKSLEINNLTPWYLGFTGVIEKTDKGFNSKGVYNWINDSSVEITELPIGTWTDDYKEFLEGLITNNHPLLKQFESHYTAKNVKFILHFVPGARAKMGEKFEIDFKLSSSKNLSINNIHLYSEEGAIKKFENTSNVIKEWSITRIKKYYERKNYQIKILEKEFNILSAKIRFILDVISGKIIIMNKKMADIAEQLITLKYPKIFKDDENDINTDNETDNEIVGEIKGFNYLLKMPISQLTYERKIILEKEVEHLAGKISVLKNTSIQQIWKNELEELMVLWKEHRETIELDYKNDKNGIVNTSAKKKKSVRAK